MLTGGRYLKLRFPLGNGLANGQQQVLGGHTVMSLHCIYFEHFRNPPN
jgi:hypothetical protein